MGATQVTPDRSVRAASSLSIILDLSVALARTVKRDWAERWAGKTTLISYLITRPGITEAGAFVLDGQPMRWLGRDK